MIRFLYSIILLMAVCKGVTCFAQATPLIHYTVDNGLPSNVVYESYRDSQGFIWFGTDKGVARYNGVFFENFTMADGLADNEIFSFKEDFEHRIWMTTYNGKLCYYKNGKFYSEKNAGFLKLPFKPFNILKIDVEEDSSITVSYGSTCFLNIKHNIVKVYDLKSFALPFKKKRILNVIKKPGSNFLIQYDNKRVVIDSLARIVSVSNNRNNRTYISCSGEDQHYLLSDSSIYSYDEAFLFPQSFPYLSDTILIQNQYLLKIYSYSGVRFFCTRNGLITDDYKQKRHLLEGNIVTATCRDLNGNFWITTHGDGIYSMSRNYDAIVRYDSVYAGRLLHKQVYKDRLYYYTSQSDQFSSFYKGNRQQPLQENIGYQKYDFEALRWALFYIVNDQKIVFFSDPKSLHTIQFLDAGKKYSSVFPGYRAAYKEAFYDGKYVYATNSKMIIRFNVDSLKIKGYSQFLTLFSYMQTDMRIVSRAMDRDRYLWFSTNDGVYKIVNGKVRRQHEFGTTSFKKFHFYGNYMVAFDMENIMSIYKVTAAGVKHIKTFSSTNIVWEDIYPLYENHLLLSTSTYYQLLTLDPATDDYSIQPLEDPFIPRNAEYIYVDSTHCYFLKDGNITSSPIKNLYLKNTSPRVLFTQLKTNGRSYDVYPAMSITGKEAANISLEYTGLSFGSKKVNYQYSISEDNTDHWGDIKGNAINLSSPGYGVYRIKLRAKGLSSDYSAPTVVQLTILRPFWATWWFILIVVLLAFGVVFMIARAVTINILKRRKQFYEIESKYYAAEYKTLNALMNPHFIFNSLNNIKGLVNRDDKKTANKFLTSFSSVIRQNMQNIAKEAVSLEEELSLVTRYLELEKIRYGDFINYCLDIDNAIDLQEIMLPPLLIQPLVENSVKHGLLPVQSADGLITIRIYSDAGSVFVAVRDNGVGLSAQKAYRNEFHESMGLQNIEKRIAYLRLSKKQLIFFSIRETLNEQQEVTGSIAIIEIKDAL